MYNTTHPFCPAYIFFSSFYFQLLLQKLPLFLDYIHILPGQSCLLQYSLLNLFRYIPATVFLFLYYTHILLNTHIFYRKVTPVRFRTINNDGYGVPYISDHFPILFTSEF